MTETTATIGGAKDFDRLYSYDQDGLVTSDNDGVNSAYNRSYGYDFLSRLTSMTAPNTPSANSSFVYDRWGNLYQATGSESWNVSINTAANQIQGFTYDNDGRLTNDGGNTYSWNALGLMTNFNGSASSYWFDAFGRRVRAATQAGTFDYFYDANGALRGVWNETSGTWKQLEIGLGSASLETYNATPPSGYSNFTYTGTSLLGSTAFRYNPGSGGLAKNYHFLPYGLEWPGEATDTTTNLKWTGHEQDSESGLYHFLFRNYSPLENRWLSPDPAGWAAADPADPFSWNRYTYVENTPLGSIDPLGLDCDPNNPGKAIPGTGPCVSGGSRTVVVAAPPPDPEAPFINPENPLYQLWWDSLPQLAEALGIGDFSKPSAAKPAAQPTSATAPQKPQKPTSQKQQCQSQYQQTVSAAQSKRTKQFLTFFTAVGVPGDILLGGCFFTEELMVPCMEGVETALGGPSVTAAVAFEHHYNSTVNNARQQMQACQEAEPGGIQ